MATMPPSETVSHPVSVQMTTLEALAWEVISAELRRTGSRKFPTDPVRRAALIAEEAGEVVKAALDLTRQPTLRKQDRVNLCAEIVHTASVSIRALMSMLQEA